MPTLADARRIHEQLDESIRRQKRQLTKLKKSLGEEAWQQYEAIADASDEEFVAAVLQFVLSLESLEKFREMLTPEQALLVDRLHETLKALVDL